MKKQIVKAGMLFFICGMLFFGAVASAAGYTPLREGDILPTASRTALVQPGFAAPALILHDLEDRVFDLTMPGKMHVLVALNQWDDVERIQKYDALGLKWKGQLDLAFIVRGNKDTLKNQAAQYTLAAPLCLQSHSEFAKVINSSTPALVVIDALGFVRYNGDWRIDTDSLDAYIEKTLALQPGQGLPTAPELTFQPRKKISHDVVPVLRATGERIEGDTFSTLQGENFPVKYNGGKATVLFLWMNYISRPELEQLMTCMKSIAGKYGGDLQLYSINTSRQEKALQRLLARYPDNPVPVLRDGDFLQYARKFPAVVILDGNGILQWRYEGIPREELLSEQIQKMKTEENAGT